MSVLRNQRKGKKLVFTNGCFDLFHAGHAGLLEHARSFGDILVVGVNSDSSIKELKGPNRPIQNTEDRMMVIASMEAVDFVVEFGDLRPMHLIEELKPDIHVKGGDYTADELPETALVRSYGGDVRIVPLTRRVSATKLIEQIRSLGTSEEPGSPA